MISAAGGRVTQAEPDPLERQMISGATVLDLAAHRQELLELASTVEPGSSEERVVDAMFVCVGRWGLSKTTVEDIARTAGISRATVYRLFPGGKNAIIQAGLATEVTRLVAALSEQLADLDDIESCLGRAVSISAVFLREHEWSAIESFLAHDRLDALLLLSGSAFGPSLMRFLPPEQAVRAATWSARIVVSHLLSPSEEVDLGDEAVARRFVATYLLPGLEVAT